MEMPTAKKKGRRPKRSELPRKKGILALAAAYSHPTRVRILTAMNAPVRRYSPKQLAQEWGEEVDLVAYHFRELVAFELLEIVDEIPRGGSIEHVHEATQTAVAWNENWKAIPPIFKQHIASLTLRLAVEAIGASIDDGRFESRDDTVLAQDTIRVDEQGAAEVLRILASPRAPVRRRSCSRSRRSPRGSASAPT